MVVEMAFRSLIALGVAYWFIMAIEPSFAEATFASFTAMVSWMDEFAEQTVQFNMEYYSFDSSFSYDYRFIN
jgi:hypothetical protein